MRILLYLTIGLTIGGVSGTLGIGGGVLLMPALIMLLGFEHPKAAGTTLAVLALPLALWPTVWKYYEQGLIDWDDLKTACWIAVAFAVGAYSGASVVTHISQEVLRLSFGLLLVYIGARFVVTANSEAASTLAGVSAAALAWLGYLVLRITGKRQLPPSVGDTIRRVHEERKSGPDYSI